MEIFYLITGILLFGEVLALYVGVFIIKKGNVQWNTLENRKYLIVDAIGGILIGFNFQFYNCLWYNYVVLGLIVLSIVLHFLRTFAFIMKNENAFCANKALFVVNNIKLVFLFGALFIALPF